jgi:hypothetical protein
MLPDRIDMSASAVIRASLEKLGNWCEATPGVRLVLGEPADEALIDALPQLIAERNAHLSVPFRAESFTVPASYRAFLEQCSFARVEYLDGETWRVYEPLNIFTPEQVAEGHSFIGKAYLDDREIHSSFLVAFATAGGEVEASRWCFITDDAITRMEGELSILCEQNDLERDLAKYVDDGSWVPGAFLAPAAYSFAFWLREVVDVVTAGPPPTEPRNDEVVNSFYTDRGES